MSGEAETACYHPKYPVISIALVDDFSSCAARVGNLVDHAADVDHIAEFTESPLDVLFPGQIANPDGVLFRQSVPFG